MYKKRKKTELPRLSLKTARELALREVGTAKGLTRLEKTPPEIYVYKMQLGNFEITIDNDVSYYKWYFRLTIKPTDGFIVDIQRVYNPETLEEDYDTEEMRFKERYCYLN